MCIQTRFKPFITTNDFPVLARFHLLTSRILSLDELPAHWDAMPPNTTCVSVPVLAQSPEYNEVLNLFLATCQQTVIKVVLI